MTQTKMDSLRRKLNNSDINVKTEACSELAWEFHDLSIDSAIFYAERAEKWITRDVTELNKGYIYHILGSVYSVAKQYSEAIPWLEKAYNIRKKEKDEVQLVATISNLVFCAQGTGDIKRTLNLILESEQICERINKRDPHLYVITLVQLADVFRDLKRFDKA